MALKKLLIVGLVMIFMTGTLSTEAATTPSLVALEPWTPEIVDQVAGGYVGSHVSIDHYENKAYVSYYDPDNGDLKLAYEVPAGTGDCPVNSSWSCEVVDSGGTNDVGQSSSIDVIDATVDVPTTSQGEQNAPEALTHYAKIGISYHDSTAKALKFALRRCTDSGCSWTITTLVPGGAEDDFGQYTSFEFNSELMPVIFYHQEFNGTEYSVGKVWRAVLKQDHPVSGNCVGKNPDWNCTEVAGSSSSSAYGSHLSANGNRVVYYDASNDRLMMATPRETINPDASMCGMTNYWDCSVIDAGNLTADVGQFASLKFDGVTSHVAYYDATNGKVKYAVSTPPNTGNCTNAGIFNCYAVDDVGSPGNAPIGISLSLDAQGQPIIAYPFVVGNDASLMIARPAAVYGTTVGNCGDASHAWQCNVVDGGGSNLNEGRFAGVSVNSLGLATVAYYEIDDNDNEGRLKVAQQHFTVNLPLIIK